jgi:transketolase
VVVVEDGHSVERLVSAFEEAKATKGKPIALICRTIKGHGLGIENAPDYHGICSAGCDNSC